MTQTPDQVVTRRSTAEVAVVRARCIRVLRRLLDMQGYLEVQTPVLQRFRDIAPLRQFHVDGAGIRSHLRSCSEYSLKRLLAEGLEQIYEIGPAFRAGEDDVTHASEFTMLEFFSAERDWCDLMRVTEALVGAVSATLGARLPPPPWRRLTVRDAVRAYLPGRPGLDELLWGPAGPASPAARRVLAEQVIHELEPWLDAPTFLTEYPAETICVAQRLEHDPRYVARWELYVHGVEVAHGLQDLVDEQEQRQRMLEVLAEKEEAHELDEDFLAALRSGLPPVAGVGIGVERLMLVAGWCASVREASLVPSNGQVRGWPG